jgi:hypothetical protein
MTPYEALFGFPPNRTRRLVSPVDTVPNTSVDNNIRGTESPTRTFTSTDEYRDVDSTVARGESSSDGFSVAVPSATPYPTGLYRNSTQQTDVSDTEPQVPNHAGSIHVLILLL